MASDKKPVWSCTVRFIAREWKEELFSEDALEASLLSAFGRVELIARAAEHAELPVTRIEYAAGPVYQAATDETPAYYSYRYFVFAPDGSKNEWELRCQKH